MWKQTYPLILLFSERMLRTTQSTELSWYMLPPSVQKSHMDEMLFSPTVFAILYCLHNIVVWFSFTWATPTADFKDRLVLIDALVLAQETFVDVTGAVVCTHHLDLCWAPEYTWVRVEEPWYIWERGKKTLI